MANRLSNGPMQVTNLSVEELNYCFQRVRQELDELRGLRGPVVTHDTVNGYPTTAPSDDALYLNGVQEFASVRDSDLSLTDIVTNNASPQVHA